MSPALRCRAVPTPLHSPLLLRARLSHPHQQLPLLHRTRPGHLEEKRWRTAGPYRGQRELLGWGKEPQAWPAAVVTRRGQLCVRLGHTWSLLYLRAQGPMPCMTRAAKEHLPDSTASVAASSMEGNQSARAVSCRAGGYGGGSWGAQTAAPTRTELRGAHADQRRPGWRKGKEKK